MPPPQPLNYAPKALQQRRWRRWAARVILVAAVVCPAILWGPGLYRRVSLIYWEHRALVDGPAPNSVVVDWLQPPGGKCNILHACISQTEIQSIIKAGGWSRFPIAGLPNIFAGEMYCPDGDRRLVFINLDPSFEGLDGGRNCGLLRGSSMRPSLDSPTSQSSTNIGFGRSILIGSQHLRIFGAQRDAANPSHLTFDCDVDGKRNTVDVWLKDDGTIDIEPRL